MGKKSDALNTMREIPIKQQLEREVFIYELERKNAYRRIIFTW